jgi:hypothetical protein
VALYPGTHFYKINVIWCYDDAAWGFAAAAVAEQHHRQVPLYFCYVAWQVRAWVCLLLLGLRRQRFLRAAADGEVLLLCAWDCASCLTGCAGAAALLLLRLLALLGA